ncbi:MAG: hypothetical protein KC493_03325 [Bacteriovoracaceae bacterium]|nr:hypothetical protein [Bacteriovoracaceae bacterium]
MTEKLEYLIMRHTDLMDMCSTCTNRILEASKAANTDAADQESLNRERLVNIIGKVQETIENEIRTLPVSGDSQDVVNLVKAWANDIEIWLQRLNNFDQEILECLEQEKMNTNKEISAAFQNKEKFKGYNLNNVKK